MVIYRKMLRVFLLVLGVSSTVFAGDCLKVKPVDNFSLKKLSGDWYITSAAITNPISYAKYRHMRCGVKNFNVINEDNKPNNFTFDMYIGKEEYTVSVSYELPDPTKGYFPMNLTEESMGKLTYDYNIVCTDYTTYLVDYACTQTSPGQSSAYLAISTRNPKIYDEIIAKPEVKKCFAEISSKPIKETVFKVPFDNCPNIK